MNATWKGIIIQFFTSVCEFIKGINWNTVAAIAPAVTSIAALVVSIIVASTQRKRDKRAQELSLFDKRYQIYCKFISVYKYAVFVRQDEQDLDLKSEKLNYLSILDMVADDYDFLEGKSYRAQHNYLLNIINTTGGEESHTADMQLYYLDAGVQKKLGYLRNTLLSEIQMAEFCYDGRICEALKRYIEELYLYISVFSKGSAQESVRNASELLLAIETIEKENTIGAMKKLLSC